MILNLIDTVFLEDILNERFFIEKDFKHNKLIILFPFFDLVLNRIQLQKFDRKLDLLKNLLNETCVLFVPENFIIQNTMISMKNKKNLDWRLHWIMPLKANHTLRIITSDKGSNEMYKREEIQTEFFQP